MPKNKEPRKLTRTQLRQLYAYSHQLTKATEEIEAEAVKRQDRIDELLSRCGSWGKLYELPHIQLLATFLIITGSVDDIIAAAQSDDPTAVLMSKIEDEWEPEGLTEQEEAQAIAVVIAVIGNFNGVRTFGLTVCEMVSRAADGDDDALLDAVSVDRSVVQAEPVARRICRAQISGREDFMQLLAKAITRTKPRRPLQKFDDLRYILAVLNETVGLDNLSHTTIAHIIIDDLQLYPDDQGDPIAGLRKLVQKTKHISRK